MTKELVSYKTTDYDKFKALQDFESAVEKQSSRFKGLAKSIKELGLLQPILVNENFEIIDGNHRFEACKSLQVPIWYILSEGYGIEQAQALKFL